jgi:hypothetical protein
MGARLTLRIYKGCDQTAFRALAEDAVRAEGGKGIVWGRVAATEDEDLRVAHSGDVHSVYLPYQGTDYAFSKKLGELGRLPWIEVSIQEGSHWDYALHLGTEVVDQFSTDPDYFHEKNDQAHLKGNPARLAALWRLPVEKIDRYIRPWGRRDETDETYHYVLSGKAYPEDRASYGDYDQFFDFVRALGGSYPEDEETHTIYLPEPRWKSHRAKNRPWWCFWR